MKSTVIDNKSKGEYISPSCSLIKLEPAAVICASGEIDAMDPVLIDDNIWDIW